MVSALAISLALEWPNLETGLQTFLMARMPGLHCTVVRSNGSSWSWGAHELRSCKQGPSVPRETELSIGTQEMFTC